MNILHLSKFYPPDKGGLEQVVQSLAEGAARARHDVRVVSCIGLSRLRFKGKRPTEPPSGGVVVVRVPTHMIVLSQPIAPMYLSAARWPADVVHLHHPHPLADVAVLQAPSRPLVVTHHSDVRRQWWLRPLYLPLVRAILRRAAAIVVPTRAHVDVSEELRGFEDKVRIIPFGVDEVRFSVRTDAPRPAALGPGPIGLFVGRLVGYKGLPVLLDAITGTDLRIAIVGDGPLREWLGSEIARRGLGRQVVVAGDVDAEDIPAWYQSSDYVVLPSVSPAEMFGITLIEAMACGKPIITTSLPTGVREVNQPGVVGLEVPPGDPAALRDAMRQMAGDSDLRHRLGAAARKRVEERFIMKKAVDGHLALYRELTGRQ